jgi:hypothetical protein
MLPSRKDRRSQAQRTIRNHAIAIVQSRRLNGHGGARDLLFQVRSRSRAFVAPVTDPSRSAIWHTAHSAPCCCNSAARPVYEKRNSDYKTRYSGVPITAGGSQGRSFDDGSTSRPIHRRGAETSRGPLVNALNRQTRVFTRPTRRHSTTSSTNCPYSPICNCRIGLPLHPPPHPTFRTTFSRISCTWLTF